MLGLLTLVDFALFIATIFTQDNRLDSKFSESYIILAFMTITIANAWVVSLCEHKIISIMTLYTMVSNEMLRNLIDQYAILQNNL